MGFTIKNNLGKVITDNGRSITVKGPLSFSNGVWRNGNGEVIDMNKLAEEQGEALDGRIEIIIEGNVERLDIQQCNSIQINGTCGRVEAYCGNVTVNGDVTGNVEANCGNVKCGSVKGNVEANFGSINYYK